MKFIVAAAIGVVFIGCQSNKQDEVQFKSRKDSVSYAIGLDIGRNLKRQAIELDLDVLAHGMKDMYTGGKTSLTDSESQSVTAEYRKQRMARHVQELKALGEKNQKAGEAYLAENKIRDSVIALPSGLQYKILKMGSGRKPKAGQTVTVNFRGSLLDGTEFENSYSSGEPVTYSVNGVIKGWTEALEMMPVGSKWTLYIPPGLAYGERGSGQVIPPNATLIFELELLQVK
jgi:FKBP-type peptidyl-prolyl cis-trans isomerase FklB